MTLKYGVGDDVENGVGDNVEKEIPGLAGDYKSDRWPVKPAMTANYSA